MKKIMFAAIVAMAMVAVGKGTGAPAEDEGSPRRSLRPPPNEYKIW